MKVRGTTLFDNGTKKRGSDYKVLLPLLQENKILINTKNQQNRASQNLIIQSCFYSSSKIGPFNHYVNCCKHCVLTKSRKKIVLSQTSKTQSVPRKDHKSTLVHHRCRAAEVPSLLGQPSDPQAQGLPGPNQHPTSASTYPKEIQNSPKQWSKDLIN